MSGIATLPNAKEFAAWVEVAKILPLLMVSVPAVPEWLATDAFVSPSLLQPVMS